jgi:hypothetical protein
MHRAARLAFVVASIASLTACGKELGRVTFTAPGTSTATVPLSAGSLGFWTDLDVEWQGDASLVYTIDFEQGGSKLMTMTCNPLGPIHVKQSWTETNLGASHSRHGLGKMECSANAPAVGATNVKATLAWMKKPASVTLKKADLVIKE